MSDVKKLNNRQIAQRLKAMEVEKDDLCDEVRDRAHLDLPLEKRTVETLPIWELLNLLTKIDSLKEAD